MVMQTVEDRAIFPCSILICHKCWGGVEAFMANSVQQECIVRDIYKKIK